MKYLLLNETLPENPEYGHYVSYSDSTDKVEYSFGHKITNQLNRVTNVISDLSGDLSDHEICIYGRGPEYSDSFWTTYGGDDIQYVSDAKVSWFPELSVYRDKTGHDINLNKLWAILSTYYSGHGDIGGWAGELVRYSSHLESELPGDQFIEAIDAYNISRLNMSLLNAITEYYSRITGPGRILGFKTGGQSMASRFTSSSDYPDIKSLMTSLSVTDSVIDQAIAQFQEFLD